MRTVPALIAALALGACGCQTLHNIGMMDRMIPQLQKLVVDRDSTSPGGKTGETLCGKDEDELRFLVAAAHQMGWEPFVATRGVPAWHRAGPCESVVYSREK
jgi:hypothetical protein